MELTEGLEGTSLRIEKHFLSFFFFAKGSVTHTVTSLAFLFIHLKNIIHHRSSYLWSLRGKVIVLEQPWLHRQLWTGGLRISKKGREHPATQIS